MKSEGESLFFQGKLKQAQEVLRSEAETAGRSCYLLGTILREGFGAVKADEDQAESYFRKGKELGDPLCAVALAADASGDESWDILNRWFPRVLTAAAAGDAAAMDEAGLFYISGGLMLNFEEGMKWLAKASLFEYWKGFLDLGKAYEEGRAVPADPDRAFLCYEKAAAFGIPEGQYRVGEALIGRMDEEDVKKGLALLEKAYAGGSAEAALLLGAFYGSEESGMPDEKKAYCWLEKAAEMDSAEAWAELALCRENGLGCEADLQEAEKCYLRAAGLGSEESRFALGLLYLEEKKDEKAFAVLKQAGENGHPRALYVTGMMYLSGKGTERNRAEGIACLEEAASLGNAESAAELEKLRAEEM